ncbi:MAG: SdrD B-like domain-containing protein [Bryobacteraceae bacterium]
MSLGKWFLMAALVVVLSSLANAQLPGAIWTSTSDGTKVNGNIYASRNDVYLNGGPQNCTGSGLPDGDYYFQVTDPSGAELLSTDPASNRIVTVTGGFITGTSDGHNTGTSSCSGAISVQLAPYNLTSNNGGEYKLWLISMAAGCINSVDGPVIDFKPSCAKTDNFKVRERDGDGEPSTGTITGMKWYDADTDGTKDEGEVPIEGWKIITETQGTTACTDADGKYYFIGMPNTTYTISEVLPPPYPMWVATTATSGTVTTDSVGDAEGPDFGNVCLGAGGGRTLGFWSNRNGFATFSSWTSPLAELTSLNLRNADGSEFNPTSYDHFRTWLRDANAVNMAYMLSAQLAAMKLNVLAGFVNGAALIYAPGTESANSAGFASVNAIIAEADAELGLHRYTPSGSQYRSYQEALKNALDQANNNMNFVQPGPCALPPSYCP